jgi:hypothetical protein
MKNAVKGPCVFNNQPLLKAHYLPLRTLKDSRKGTNSRCSNSFSVLFMNSGTSDAKTESWNQLTHLT